MTKKLFLCLCLISCVVIAEQRRGRVREFFRSPFNQNNQNRPARRATPSYNPIVNRQGERTIAINGIAVPAGAIGYRFRNGMVSWVFQNGQESPEISNPGVSPSPSPQAPGPHSGPGAQPSAPRRPVADPGQEAQLPSRPAPQTPSGSASPSQAGSSSPDLFPAGTNGNPGFPYLVRGTNFSEKCQATLSSNDNDICVASTAAHCLIDGVMRAQEKGFDPAILGKPSCNQDIQNRGALWGKGQIETADFGKVEATFYINPEYNSGSKSEDSAVFVFPCKKNASVPVVPVVSADRAALKDGETVYYGKVMGGKQGLYPGVIRREPNVVKINHRPVGEAQEAVWQPQDRAIQQGDSGGGIYRKIANGSFELVGVLSTGDDLTRRRPIGNYATNRSLDFIRCIQHAIRNRRG